MPRPTTDMRFALRKLRPTGSRPFGIHVPNKTLTIEQVLSLLAETPLRIAALTAGLAPAQLHTAPALDKWSANDVLAHLRACADIWGNCMKTMIAEDRPTLRAVNPRSWINETNYLELEFRPSLRAFARQRADLLAVLDPLPRKGWSRVAMNSHTSSRSQASSTSFAASQFLFREVNLW
jgi:hypothetical protein